jgi:tetratricopeptide (TPR) repeat protein
MVPMVGFADRWLGGTTARWWRRLCVWAPAVAIALGPAMPATVAWGADVEIGSRWIEVSSPHLTVFSNAGRRKTTRIATELEQLRAVLSLQSRREAVEGVPTVVYLFENEAAFAPFRYLVDGEPAVVGGFFRPTHEALVIAVDATAGYDLGTVFHEFVHSWLSRTVSKLPLWVEEGLAELYQTFSVARGRAKVGRPIERHVAWLRSNPLIPLEELFAVDHRDPLYTGTHRRSGFYAQSWALVHLLVLGESQRAAQLEAFVDDISRGTPQAAAFERAFDGDIAGLEEALRRFVHRDIFRIVSVETEIEAPVGVEVRRMSEAEVLNRLGELLLGEDGLRPEAAAYFERALAAGGEDGRALVGLARLAERSGDRDRAAALYQRALASTPDDPVVLYRCGAALVDGQGDAAEAAAILRRSVDLAPEFGPAWSALTAALLDLGAEGGELLEAARVAYRLMPRDRDAAWDLLAALVASGRWCEARSFVESGFADRPADRARALATVVREALDAAHGLMADGQCDVAGERVDWAAASLDDAPGVAGLRQRVERGRNAVARCRLARRIREAEEMLAAGDSEAARSALAEVVENPASGELTERARRLLERIDQPHAAGASSTVVITAVSQTELDRLNDLIAGGELEKALTFLRELGSRVGPSERAWIDSKIDEVRRAVDESRYVDGFNRAVDLYNDRDYEGAVRVLERLLAQMPAGWDSSSARSLLARARTATARQGGQGAPGDRGLRPPH